MRTTLVTLAVLALAGCGGSAKQAAPPPKPPHLPRALAQSWAAQADAVAQSLAAGDGCGAQQRATQLRDEVVQAVNGHRIPARLQETLTAAVNDLPDRITCNPAPPTPQPPPAHDHGNGNGKDHGKHKGHGEGDG